MKKPSPKNQLTITGTSGDDLLIGTQDADEIYGLGGNDTIIGAGYFDKLYGGPGDDIYRAESPIVAIFENVGEGFDKIYAELDYTIQAGQEIELLAFSDPASTRNVTLTGNAFAQTIVGNAGDNHIFGGLGNDVMAGLLGNDEYRVDDAGDVIFENAGEGAEFVYVAAALKSYTLTPGSELETLLPVNSGTTQGVAFTGNEYNNRVNGTAGSDTLIGGGGNDILTGERGSDFYRVEDLGDIVEEWAGNSNPGDIDSIYVAMSLSGYVLADTATFGPLQIEVLGAIDPNSTATFNLTGNYLGNTIFGSAGQNTLIGGGGADTLVGFGGDDFYRVEDILDQVTETAGNGFDRVYADTASYTLPAGSYVELLAAIDPASTSAMNLAGNAFANEVYGNAGANVIDGRGGTDLLYGYGGADTFAFTTAYDAGDVDTIGDFTAGTDKIGLDDAIFPFVGGPGALNPNAFVVGNAAADADDRVIYNNMTGQLFYDADGNGAGAAVLFATLTGAPTLAASDFVVI
jgi:serralysin